MSLVNDIIDRQRNKESNIIPLQKKRKTVYFEKDSEAFASGDINKNVNKVEDQTLIDSIEANLKFLNHLIPGLQGLIFGKLQQSI